MMTSSSSQENNNRVCLSPLLRMLFILNWLKGDYRWWLWTHCLNRKSAQKVTEGSIERDSNWERLRETERTALLSGRLLFLCWCNECLFNGYCTYFSYMIHWMLSGISFFFHVVTSRDLAKWAQVCFSSRSAWSQAIPADLSLQHKIFLYGVCCFTAKRETIPSLSVQDGESLHKFLMGWCFLQKEAALHHIWHIHGLNPTLQGQGMPWNSLPAECTFSILLHSFLIEVSVCLFFANLLVGCSSHGRDPPDKHRSKDYYHVSEKNREPFKTGSARFERQPLLFRSTSYAWIYSVQVLRCSFFSNTRYTLRMHKLFFMPQSMTYRFELQDCSLLSLIIILIEKDFPSEGLHSSSFLVKNKSESVKKSWFFILLHNYFLQSCCLGVKSCLHGSFSSSSCISLR